MKKLNQDDKVAVFMVILIFLIILLVFSIGSAKQAPLPKHKTQSSKPSNLNYMVLHGKYPLQQTVNTNQLQNTVTAEQLQ